MNTTTALIVKIFIGLFFIGLFLPNPYSYIVLGILISIYFSIRIYFTYFYKK